jgi:hypothetical protein
MTRVGPAAFSESRSVESQKQPNPICSKEEDDKSNSNNQIAARKKEQDSRRFCELDEFIGFHLTRHLEFGQNRHASTHQHCSCAFKGESVRTHQRKVVPLKLQQLCMRAHFHQLAYAQA